jgi:polyisoprenoid-binding protein YceI
MASPINLAEGSAAAYVLDPARSRFLVRASATGLLSAFGHNPTVAVRGFKGEAWFPNQAPEQSWLRFEIDANSLVVTGDVNERDRHEMERTMRDEVLETKRYPEIRFESFGIEANNITEGMYRMNIRGHLILHGVKREVAIPCNVTVSGDSLRANGEFSIRQTDFGIRLVSVAGGTLKLKDELKFTFDLVGHRMREEQGD